MCTFATDDCLPYCWLPKWDFIHSLGGVYQYGIEDENWCKVTCTYAKKCNGIDFNKTDETCWLLYDTHLMQTPSKAAVNHWEIERNLPEICSNGKFTILISGAVLCPRGARGYGGIVLSLMNCQLRGLWIGSNHNQSRILVRDFFSTCVP